MCTDIRIIFTDVKDTEDNLWAVMNDTILFIVNSV